MRFSPAKCALFGKILLSLLIVVSSFAVWAAPAVAAFSISLSPVSGNPGTTITVTGSGFSANTAGVVWFDSDGDGVKDSTEPYKNVTTTAAGAIPSGTTLTVPYVAAGGTYYIRADIPSGSSVEASASFTVIVLSLSPSTCVMDTATTITVTGSGFTANASGWVWFDLDNDSIMDGTEPQASVTTTATGAIPAGVTLNAQPPEPATTYRVRADIPSGGSVEASKDFTTAGVTTRLTVTKYNAYGNVIATRTVTYQWLEGNLTAYGDGLTTRYYCEGPYFTTDYNTLWDSTETGNNIDSRDYGIAKGTDVKDICGLAGGASAGDTIKIVGSDNMSKWFDYDNIYNPEPEQGKLVVCWYNASFGGYVPTYDTGMRLLFFAETTNPDGKYVFGHWDMHQTLPASRWYYYNDVNPSSGGLSVQKVYNIEIHQPNLISCDASGTAKDSFLPGDTVYVKGLGLTASNGYKLWIQGEPVLLRPLNELDQYSGDTYTLTAANDPSGAQELVATDASGDFASVAIWSVDLATEPAQYDIVADNQGSGTIGTYDASDAIDNPGWHGFEVTIPPPTQPDWDLNGDHVCDIGDVVKIGLCWGQTGSAGWIPEDVNNDGVIDIGDVVVIGLHWGETW